MYPSSIFSFRSLVDRVGAVYDAAKTKVFYAKDHNDLGNELIAIETELGLNPKGDYDSVVDRLDENVYSEDLFLDNEALVGVAGSIEVIGSGMVLYGGLLRPLFSTPLYLFHFSSNKGIIVDIDTIPKFSGYSYYESLISGIDNAIPSVKYVNDRSFSIPWTEVIGTTQAMGVNNGYIVNNASLVTLTLPVIVAVGQIVKVSGKGFGGWKIAQNAGQLIKFLDQVDGELNTTTGIEGYLQSVNYLDSIELLCVVANTTFKIINGNNFEYA